MADWYTFDAEDEDSIERLVTAWRDAPIENPEVLSMILEVAQEDVIAYAPRPDGPSIDQDGYIVPSFVVKPRYVLAQLSQAKNLWEAGRVNSGGEVGAEGFVFTPRPLDATIRKMIRPVNNKPHVL